MNRQHQLDGVYDQEADTPTTYLPRWFWVCSCGARSAIWFTDEDRAVADHTTHTETEPHVPNYRPWGRST
jgi:hypothetical protein